MDAGLKAVREQACSACPSCVYCRGHHLPSVRVRISGGSHHPPHPLPWLPISLQWVFFSATSHSRMSNATLCSFSVAPKQAFIGVLKTKAFDTPGLFEYKKGLLGGTAVRFLGSCQGFCSLFLCCKVGYSLIHPTIRLLCWEKKALRRTTAWVLRVTWNNLTFMLHKYVCMCVCAHAYTSVSVCVC